VVRRGAIDSVAHLTRTEGAGRLSPALITGLRAASRIRDEADSIELVIVSPVGADEIDNATLPIRALWPGRVRVVRVSADTASASSKSGVAIQGPPDDPLIVAARAARIPLGDTAVRVVRGVSSAADSAWATLGRRVLVRWPEREAPGGWIPRPTNDTAAAVIAGEVALVAPFARRWAPDSTARSTRVVARWVDGQPAATERTVGSGCIRDVAIPVPAQGDLVLRPSFGRFLRAIVAPCHTVPAALRPAEPLARALAGEGRLAASSAIRTPDVVVTPLVPWLLGAALLAMLLELAARR
jgi:hypothetical protein